MVSAKIRPYVDRAKAAILELIEEHHALVWLEVEARLADVQGEPKLQEFHPHILTLARRELAGSDLEEVEEVTRGQRRVSVLVRSGSKRSRATADAAARKRLLQARFLSWGTETKKRPNLLGRGGELALRESLLAAAPRGFMPVTSQAGAVTKLLGVNVPIGPLDNGARLVLVGQEATAPVITLPIEVKNVRHWLYPQDAEFFQLLDKSAQLQVLLPDHPIMPLLVCRRAHYWSYKMARDLGFFICDTREQFLAPHATVPATHVNEVRDELGYRITVVNGPHIGLVKRLENAVASNAARIAARFRQTALVGQPYFARLRNPKLSEATRDELRNELYDAVSAMDGFQGGWRTQVRTFDEEDPDEDHWG